MSVHEEGAEGRCAARAVVCVYFAISWNSFARVSKGAMRANSLFSFLMRTMIISDTYEE